jgi:hypothetical protein
MEQSSIGVASRHFSARASLAALGVKLQRLDLFGPIRARVQIGQKTVKHRPIDKLYDAFIAMLAGAHGLVEINTRLRSDPGLQAAFGREACAEQSVVQTTLDACTAENLTQMEAALDEIYQRHSQGYQHDYEAHWQVLDADMSGLPCGRKAAFASKGYFAKQRNRRGRQLGRVVASLYAEVVVDRLFAGHTQLASALQPLVLAAEGTLTLDAAKRQRTILRVDAGGGSVGDVNWLLQRGYAVHGKDYSTRRAQRLAAGVTEWIPDPYVPERQVGWVTDAPTDYCQPLQRIAVRCRKNNGQWGVGVLLSAVPPQDIIALTATTHPPRDPAHAALLAYVYFYDQRGGGVESTFKGDKHGLGLTKRNKKRWEAQQMLMLLGTLAHNVTVWSRHWMAPQQPKLARFGTLRLVRDLFHISGFVVRDTLGQVVQVVLNQAAPLAASFAAAFTPLLAQEHVAITLGQI